jgi:AP-4 complex subunit sigma-1
MFALRIKEVHFLVDEMVQNGFIVETNKSNILRPIALMERENQKVESMFR